MLSQAEAHERKIRLLQDELNAVAFMNGDRVPATTSSSTAETDVQMKLDAAIQQILEKDNTIDELREQLEILKDGGGVTQESNDNDMVLAEYIDREIRLQEEVAALKREVKESKDRADKLQSEFNVLLASFDKKKDENIRAINEQNFFIRHIWWKEAELELAALRERHAEEIEAYKRQIESLKVVAQSVSKETGSFMNAPRMNRGEVDSVLVNAY